MSEGDNSILGTEGTKDIQTAAHLGAAPQGSPAVKPKGSPNKADNQIQGRSGPRRRLKPAEFKTSRAAHWLPGVDLVQAPGGYQKVHPQPGQAQPLGAQEL